MNSELHAEMWYKEMWYKIKYSGTAIARRSLARWRLGASGATSSRRGARGEELREVVPCTGEHARRCCAAWYVESMMHRCLGWWFFLLLGFVSGTLI